MPPASPPPFIDLKEKQRPPQPKEPAGPIIGTVIVVILLICGVLYFWGALLNKQRANDTVPLIARGASTESTRSR